MGIFKYDSTCWRLIYIQLFNCCHRMDPASYQYNEMYPLSIDIMTLWLIMTYLRLINWFPTFKCVANYFLRTSRGYVFVLLSGDGVDGKAGRWRSSPLPLLPPSRSPIRGAHVCSSSLVKDFQPNPSLQTVIRDTGYSTLHCLLLTNAFRR